MCSKSGIYVRYLQTEVVHNKEVPKNDCTVWANIGTYEKMIFVDNASCDLI